MSDQSSFSLKISKEIDSKIQNLVQGLPEPTSYNNISLLVETVSTAFKDSDDSLVLDPNLVALLESAPSDFSPIDPPPAEPVRSWAKEVEKEELAKMPQSSAAGLGKDRPSLGKSAQKGAVSKTPRSDKSGSPSISKAPSTPSGSPHASQASYVTACSDKVSVLPSDVDLASLTLWKTLPAEVHALYATLTTEMDLLWRMEFSSTRLSTQ